MGEPWTHRMAWLSMRAVPLGGGAADSRSWEYAVRVVDMPWSAAAFSRATSPHAPLLTRLPTRSAMFCSRAPKAHHQQTPGRSTRAHRDFLTHTCPSSKTSLHLQSVNDDMGIAHSRPRGGITPRCVSHCTARLAVAISWA